MGKILKVLAALVIFLIFTGALSFFMTTKMMKDNAEVDKPAVENTEKSSTAEKDNKTQNEDSLIIVSIYQPSKFDTKATAPYYVIIKNNNNKQYEGSFELEGIESQKQTDKIGHLKLKPNEAVIVAGKGNIPSKSQVKIKLDGKFGKETFERNPSIDYTIVKKELTNGGSILSIYVAPNTPDDNYLAISKELKKNYNTKLIIADFSPVMISPDKQDVRITYAKNEIMKFSHVLFYTTDTNNVNIQEMERRIVDI